jgi:hypothetical protein
MERTPLTKLELCTSLDFIEFSDFSTVKLTEKEEILLCFEVNPAQNRSIEPDPALFLGSPVFSGRKNAEKDAKTVSLPAGSYLFSQERQPQEEAGEPETPNWLDLAIEQHKDALWERHKPGNRLYVRFLFEDGGLVTQVFRTLDG